MKYLLTILLCLFLSVTTDAQIVLVTSVNALSAGAGVTSSAINTTGATGLFVVETYRPTEGATFSDSKSNSWTATTKYEGVGNQAGIIGYYCTSCIVGTSHTFTTSNHFGSISVFAFSGTRTATTSFDQINGQWIATLGTTATPGSITPTANGEVVLTGVMDYNGVQPTLPTGYAGFTWPTATAFSGGAAYKIQTTITSENPSWGNMSAGNNGSVIVFSFFAPVAAALSNFNLLLTEW